MHYLAIVSTPREILEERNREIEAHSRLNTVDSVCQGVVYAYADELLAELAGEVYLGQVVTPLNKATRLSAAIYQRMFKDTMHAWKLSYVKRCKGWNDVSLMRQFYG